MKTKTLTVEETIELGQKIGLLLKGGEVIELISDLGGGKTQFVRGLARGMGSKDQVQSPSFTISRVYRGDSLELWHFDFHRLPEPGVVKHELAEAIGNENKVVAIEWPDSVEDVLPKDRLVVEIRAEKDSEREISINSTGPNHDHLLKLII